MKKFGWIFIVLAFVLFVNFFVKVSIVNSVADAETLVVQAKDDCASTYDNGIKSVVEMAQVDKNTKEYILTIFKSGNPEEKKKVQGAYGEMLNGNSQPFMVLMQTMSGTNFTITAENLQREISARRSEMLTCSKTLNASQRNLKKVAGLNSANEIVRFPHFLYNVEVSSVSDQGLLDNDGDGVLTVLDYRPPVSVQVSESFDTGEGIPPLNIYE